jgi:hypothetical protein
MAWLRQHQQAIGIGVAALALVLLVVAGFLGWATFTKRPSMADLGSSSQPSASTVSSPSAGATPAFEPMATPEPTPGFEAPAGILPPNSRAVVVVDALQVREQAGLNAAVMDTLPAGTVVELRRGYTDPEAVDGIDWYHVDYDRDLFGVVAGGVGGERYLKLLPARCEDGDSDLAALMRITAWERLACFGDSSITVTGTYGCPVCGIAYPRGGYEPAWLANPDTLAYLGWPDAIALHFGPEAGLPPNASIVRVTGHFSDPASSTCVIRPTMDGFPIGAEVDPVIAELWCREQFVVEAYEIIGTDPDFTHSFAPA